MIAADSVDTTVIAAFAVGFISFVSPCVLPLVPGYLSTISGVSFAEIQEGRGRAQVLGPALLFCLAFTAMFVALGMTATGLGQTLQDNRQLLRQISGVVIVLLGVLFIATLFIPKLNKEWRPEELMRRAHTGGPIVAGLAFAVAWLPCTGPTLGAILTAASTENTVGEGGVLLAFYAFGLAVPFILSALAFSTFTGVFKFFRNHYTVITLVSGSILIVMGVLLFTNELTRLNSEALSLMDDLGIIFFNEILLSSGLFLDGEGMLEGAVFVNLDHEERNVAGVAEAVRRLGRHHQQLLRHELDDGLAGRPAAAALEQQEGLRVGMHVEVHRAARWCAGNEDRRAVRTMLAALEQPCSGAELK